MLLYTNKYVNRVLAIIAAHRSTQFLSTSALELPYCALQFYSMYWYEVYNGENELGNTHGNG